MSNHERTERSTAAGLHVEVGKSPGARHGGSVAAVSGGSGTDSEFVRWPDWALNVEQAPAPGVFAAVLSLSVTGGPWFRPATGRDWEVLLTAAAVSLIALLRFVWLYRARSSRRWNAALDAYAEREIARDRRRKAPPR